MQCTVYDPIPGSMNVMSRLAGPIHGNYSTEYRNTAGYSGSEILDRNMKQLQDYTSKLVS